VIEDYKKQQGIDYDAKTYERDMRGSFIALKIPAMEGRLIDTPVRLDKLYQNLIDNHFQNIELDKLGPLPDSPYK
jgi:hypothetical protein